MNSLVLAGPVNNPDALTRELFTLNTPESLPRLSTSVFKDLIDTYDEASQNFGQDNTYEAFHYEVRANAITSRADVASSILLQSDQFKLGVLAVTSAILNTADFSVKVAFTKHSNRREDAYARWSAYAKDAIVVSNHSQSQTLSFAGGKNVDARTLFGVKQLVSRLSEPSVYRPSDQTEREPFILRLQALTDDELYDNGLTVNEEPDRKPLLFTKEAPIISRENPTPGSATRVLLAITAMRTTPIQAQKAA